MINSIRIIDLEGYDKAIRDFEKNNTFGAVIEYSSFELLQFESFPDKEFISPTNYPNCCNFHQNLLKTGKELFQNFPNCCSDHKNLVNANWFKKEEYKYIELKIVNTITFTIHYLERHSNNEKWYNLIH